MDPVLETVRALRFEGGVFLDAAFAAPWCVFSQVEAGDCAPHQPPPPRIVAYHYVTQGTLFLELEGMPALQVEAGHLIVLPRNDPHRLGSDLGHPPVPAGALIRPGVDGALARIETTGVAPDVRLLCGYLGAGPGAAPLLEALPRVLTVSVADGIGASWIESSLRYAAQQLSEGAVSSPHLLGQVASLLFADAVRRFVATLPDATPAWLVALRDPLVGRALALLDARPHDPWTTPSLARAVGTSRTVLHDRFVGLLGQPPMRYLQHRRLERAAERLQTTTDAVAAVAWDCGYGSEAAFTRAFKRVYGAPPGSWRRAR